MTERLDRFEQLFRRYARRIRLLLFARGVLSGAAVGALVGAGVAAVLWRSGQGAVRPFALVAVLGGALIVAAVVAQRRRWSDTHVALFLDARLDTAEAVTSALAAPTEQAELARALQERACQTLASAQPRRLRIRWLLPLHLALPVGLALGSWISVLPLPARASAPTAPGRELVKHENLSGLDRIEALERAPGLSEADAQRLRQLSRQAQKLRADLVRGLERREAQARAAKLRDDIAAEQQRFGDKAERPGVDAAVSALGAQRFTQAAAKALGEGDLVAFDAEMQALANQAESRARDAARAALEEALQGARDRGSKKLAALLERQAKLFAEREGNAAALRELAEHLKDKLGAQARRDLDELGASGSLEAQQRLAKAVIEALKGLSEAERQKLAEALGRQLSNGQAGNPLTAEQLEELASKLSTDEGQRALAEQLRKLSQSSPDAERERALEEAERGGAEAQRGLGVLPVPSPGQSGVGQGNAASPGQQPGQGNAAGRGGGAAGHAGQTPALHGDELRARAATQLLPGAPLATRSLGRAEARPGETARQLGTGNLGNVGAGEVSAVEGADIPEAYREQVGRYFEP